MSDYRLSGKADDDLGGIYLYSYRHFGETKADEYLLALAERFFMLAEQPHLGKQIDYIRDGYRRFDHESHAIFYQITDFVVQIMRILHSM